MLWTVVLNDQQNDISERGKALSSTQSLEQCVGQKNQLLTRPNREVYSSHEVRDKDMAGHRGRDEDIMMCYSQKSVDSKQKLKGLCSQSSRRRWHRMMTMVARSSESWSQLKYTFYEQAGPRQQKNVKLCQYRFYDWKHTSM